MDKHSKDSILPLDIEQDWGKGKEVQVESVYCDGSIILSNQAGEEGVEAGSDGQKRANMVIGILFMLATVFFISLGHILIKFLSISSPYITPYDVTLFMGLFNVPVNFYVGKRNGVSMNVFSYSKTIILIMFARMIVGFGNNLCLMYSIQLIPLSKSIFIFSMNPLCCAILAAILLKERLQLFTMFCVCGACSGIFLLMLNKENEGEQAESILGYILVICAAWLAASIFITVRFMNLYKVHITLNSFMIGLVFLTQSSFALFFGEDLINFGKYTLMDVGMLVGHGILSIGWLSCMFFANKYAQASVVAPMMNFENMLTVLCDIFFFQYHFIGTDILGMVILSICIMVPILFNYCSAK